LAGALLLLMAAFFALLWLPMAPLVTQGAPPHAAQAAMLTQRPWHDVRIVSHGWHTCVVVSAQDLYAHVPALQIRFPAANWLELGWGDAGFYQADEISAAIALDALFWPDPAVVHVVGFTPAALRKRPLASCSRSVRACMATRSFTPAWACTPPPTPATSGRPKPWPAPVCRCRRPPR
jgi:hypothetical protein